MHGIEIDRRYDELGPITVFDDGPYRILRFGEGGEQSRIERARPYLPVYQYSQAMLLALLFEPAPDRALLLGLGGGALAHSLLQYSDNLEISAAELRPQVAAIARQLFQLPSERLNITIEDALTYLQQDSSSYDLIFTDIYNDNGMEGSQLNPEYLSHCHHLLSDHGILVMNLWDEGKGSHPLARQQISEQFGEQWLCCPADSGNLVAYAFKGGIPAFSNRSLIPLARKLEKKMQFPARKMINRLQGSEASYN